MSAGNQEVRNAVARSAVTLLSSRFTVAGMAIIFIAITTRILSLREMALFAVYNSLCALQTMVCALGLFTTSTRELPDMMGKGDLDGASRMVKTSLLTNTVNSMILAGAMAIMARPICILFLKDDAMVNELRLAIVGVFLWNQFEGSQLLLVAAQRFRGYGRSNIVCAVAQKSTALLMFVLLTPRDLGLLGFMAGYAAGTFVGVISSHLALHDLIFRRSGFAPLRPLVKFSAPFYADGYLRYLYMQADQLLIGIFLSPEVLSLYFVAKRFAQYYQTTVASTIDPVLAKVAEMRSKGKEALEHSLKSASRYFALVFIPLAAAAASMSTLFLDLAGGALYREALPILVMLSLSVAAYAAFNLITGYVYMLGVPSDRLKFNMVTGLSQALMMTILLGAARMGNVGPVASAALIALARIGALILGLSYAHYQLRRFITPIYEIRAVPRSLLASGLMSLAIMLPQMAYYHPLLVPAYGLVGAVLFVLVIRPEVREEDLALLGGVLNGRASRIEQLARKFFNQSSGNSHATE
jgi:O-antigen/teichoic acid export membrane protein